MKIHCHLLLLAASLPANASEAKLYQRLEALELMKGLFVAQRTPTGVDFVGNEQAVVSGRKHSRFHIEVEGPIPSGATSLQSAVAIVSRVIEPEVDRKHPERNTIYPGLGVDIVDVNGAHVAFLQYKSSREPNTFMRRAVIYAAGKIYTVTMSLHSTDEKDRMGMYLPILVIDMVNSNQIPELRT
jgi:hypothetical protein